MPPIGVALAPCLPPRGCGITGPEVAVGWRPGTVDDVADGLMTLFLCGDVMLGRGVDQVLPHPGDPELRERCAGDARAYVRLAERATLTRGDQSRLLLQNVVAPNFGSLAGRWMA